MEPYHGKCWGTQQQRSTGKIIQIEVVKYLSREKSNKTDQNNDRVKETYRHIITIK